jgi:hypothetical protein
MSLEEGLRKHLPSQSIPAVLSWMNGYPVHLKLSRGRRSKLGDYRPPIREPFHRISVNHDLNTYEFLLTLTHEIAHMMVWEQYRGRVKPHGKRWKEQYTALVKQLISMDIFPDDLRVLISEHILDPGANSKGNTLLARALHAHNPVNNGVLLEDLPENSRFTLPDGRRFIKQQRLRKWYRCLSLENRKPYRISPVAMVNPIED